MLLLLSLLLLLYVLLFYSPDVDDLEFLAFDDAFTWKPHMAEMSSNMCRHTVAH